MGLFSNLIPRVSKLPTTASPDFWPAFSSVIVLFESQYLAYYVLIRTWIRLVAPVAARFEHELTGANINRISTDAGCAKGTVYNYFPSREALFSAVLEGGSEQAVARYRPATSRAASPATPLALKEPALTRRRATHHPPNTTRNRLKDATAPWTGD